MPADFKLERSIWDKEQYAYMSLEDSKLYDELKDSDNPKDQKICQLILDKAKASWSDHCNMTY